MAVVMRCEIGFPPTYVDYGPEGQNFLKDDYKYEETAEAGVGIGTLNLEGTWGTDADIREKMVIRHYLWDTSTLRVTGWLFYGVLEIPTTSRIAGTGQKTWALSAHSWNIALTTVVGEAAWAPGVHVPAGDFATQVNAVAQGLCAGSSLGIDSSSYVANLYTGTLPAQVITGKNLLNALGMVFAQARALNPLLAPACFIGPDPLVPGLLGPPVLQVYDLAVALARSPTKRYSDRPADILSGARLPILPTTPPDRQRDATTLVQRGQSVTPSGLVYTSVNAASIAAYPHPLAANHAWSVEAVADTSNHGASVNATATATISGGAVTGYVMTGIGNGYPGPPLVRITGDGSGAVGVAVMGGHVLGGVPSSGGSGYGPLTAVVFTGGGGTGAVAVPVIAAGVITGITMQNLGSGFTSLPAISFTDPAGGTGAAFTAVIGGQVIGVTPLAGGSGYTTATVAFVDGVQAVLDATIAQTAEPVESPRVLVADKPNAGENVSITLALEAGIVDVTYRVVKIASDYSIPGYPVHALDLNRRRRTLGEPPDQTVPTAPIEGVLPSPPSNFVYQDSYNWATDRADQVFSWTPPPVPNGTSSYDVVVLVVATGLIYHHFVDGVTANTLRLSVNPGEHQIAYVVGRNGAGVPSVPTPTIDYTTAAATVPAPPTLALDTGTYPPSGWGWNEHGAYAGFLLTPGAGYPADHFEFETWETATPAVKTLHDPIPGNAAAFVWADITATVAYSYHIRGVNAHGTPGGWGSTGTLTVPSNAPTAPGSVAETDAFNWGSGETDVAVTWTASTPGVGRTLRAYDITFTLGGETYVYEYGPASLGGTLSVPPGSVISGLIVQAKDDLYALGPASSPALGWTVADRPAPPPAPTLPTFANDAPIPGGQTGSLTLGWTHSTGTHTFYEYWWYITGGPSSPIVRVDGALTSAVVSGVPIDQLANYQLRTVDTHQTGPWLTPPVPHTLASSPGNLVYNGDFEGRDPARPSHADGWDESLQVSTATSLLDGAQVFTGLRSLKQVKPATGTATAVVISRPVALPPASSWRLSYRYVDAGTNTGGTAEAAIYYFNEGGFSTGAPAVQSSPLAGAGGWAGGALTIIGVPTGTTYIRVQLRIPVDAAHACTVWWDAVSFVALAAGSTPRDPDWTPSDVTRIVLDPTHGYRTPAAYQFSPAVSSTLTLAHLSQPAAPGQVWGMDGWYEKDSGAAAALSVTWAWYSGPNGTGTLLSTDTDTLATPTTAWKEAAMKHVAPSGAASLIVSVIVSLGVSLGVLWLDIPVPPAPAAIAPQLAPTGMTFYHPTTGAALSTLSVDATTGALSVGSFNPTSGTDTPLVGTSTNGIGVTGISTNGYGVEGQSTASFGVHGIAAGAGPGVVGENTSTGAGVSGIADSGFGVVGRSTSGAGVGGTSSSGASGFFRHAVSGNAAAVILSQQRGAGTAHLFSGAADAGTELFFVDSAGVVQPAGYNAADGSAGLSTTIVLAKITPGGTNGSIVIKNGIVTSYTAPT